MTDKSPSFSTHPVPEYRAHFYVANLPLTQPITCGPFSVEPTENGVKDAEPRDPWSIRCEATCIGLRELGPDAGDIGAAWNLLNHDLRDLHLLLTWVNHSPAPIFDVSLEVAQAGSWKRVRSSPVIYGTLVRSLSGMREVQQRANVLVEFAWAAFQRRDLAYDRHLKACLVYYAEAVGADMADARFVLGWMALEVLLSGADMSMSILNSNRFKRVRSELAQMILKYSAEYPSEAHMSAAVDKLPELNRWPLKSVARECFNQLFPWTSRDERETGVEEVLALSRTRNNIVHTGGIRPWTGLAGQDEVKSYLETMNREWLRLHDLLTRCIYALISQAATEDLVQAVLARLGDY